LRGAALGFTQHPIGEPIERARTIVTANGLDRKEEGGVSPEIGQKQKLGQRNPQMGFEQAGPVWRALFQQLAEDNVEVTVTAQSAGHQPIGERAVAGVGKIAFYERREAIAAQNARQGRGCGNSGFNSSDRLL
jgi:hypothetical protein